MMLTVTIIELIEKKGENLVGQEWPVGIMV